MISCQYCGVYYEQFQSICPSCGAPLQITPQKTEEQIAINKIRLICDSFMNPEFQDGEYISDKRLDTIRKSFQIFPSRKKIFIYCDTTPLRTNKRGFLICDDGVYWQNSWTTPTNRNFINWDTYKNREISHKKFDLDLGKGDVIDLAGLGSNTVRETVAKLFLQIHKVLNEQS